MHTSFEIQHCKLRESFLKSWVSLSTTLLQDCCSFCYKTQKTIVQKQERPPSFFHFPQLGCCGYCLSLSVNSRNFLYYSGVSWFVGKTINRAKEMNAVSTKVLVRFFSSSLPMCAVYFDLVMPKHLLSPCYAFYEHTRSIKRYVTYYLACYVRLQVQNMSYDMRL
jgi:hypothetical protein